MPLKGTLKQQIKLWATWHSPSDEPNVFIHSLPRSGSTWLMELILTQPWFAAFNEPLNLRKSHVQDHLGMKEWKNLHTEGSREALRAYFGDICSGRLRDARFLRPAPFSSFYRPVTRRIVFKIINAAEEHINWLAETFNGRTLYLLRHPVPVSLSRRYAPKLDVMLDTEVQAYLSVGQRSFAREMIARQNRFGHAVLDWAIRNTIALKSRTDDWTIVTYEQLTLDPAPAIDWMTTRLALPKPDRIRRRLSAPSRSTRLSNHGTQEVLRADHSERKQRWLIEKWTEEVTREQLSIATDILEAFDLSSIYQPSETLPNSQYWLR